MPLLEYIFCVSRLLHQYLYKYMGGKSISASSGHPKSFLNRFFFKSKEIPLNLSGSSESINHAVFLCIIKVMRRKMQES